MFGFMRKKPIFPYIETQIVIHCNLKCKYCCSSCDHIKDEFFVKPNEYKNDLLELTKKVEIEHIRILGGEPLLHPDVTDFLRITRNILPNAEINLVTNGILLPKMDENFWEILKDNNIVIDFSLYPIWEDKGEHIINLIKSHGIELNTKYTNNFMIQYNENGTSNQQKAYDICYSKKCINLWDHKLYQCDKLFRYYFNSQIPLPPEYDIYENSGRKLYKNLVKNKKSFAACKYCQDEYKFIKWSKSTV